MYLPARPPRHFPKVLAKSTNKTDVYDDCIHAAYTRKRICDVNKMVDQI